MHNQEPISHWIPCPICKQETVVKVSENTTLLRFPLSCHNCKKDTIIIVVKLMMTVEEIRETV